VDRALIEFRNVSKLYGRLEAVKGLSFKVERGEVLTLLGPNGSGKSTILKMIAGLETPTKGDIFFDGVKIKQGNVAEVRRRCTMIFQRTVLLRGTVFGNVAYGLRLRRLKEKEVGHRAEEALQIVGILGLKDRNVRSLSGGEQQRLSIARALALNSEVLLLDEPTANLDPESLSVVQETLSWLNRETDTTIVMATHNILQARELSERLVLLERGEVIKSGGPSALFLTPSSEFERFVITENIFTGISSIVEGISNIDIGGGLDVKATFSRPGRVAIQVRPENIIISKRWVESSARNQFEGSIIAVEDLGPVVKLKVDAGKVFTVQITRKSFTEMGLNLGSEIFLTFKASAVRLIQRPP
jgi:tungstate transport system ATP-binding protein